MANPFFSFPGLALIGALTLVSLPAKAGEHSTLRLAYKSDILSLDPHAIAEATQLDVLGNVYEPLVTFDADGKPSPALATRWQQLTETRWRFHLRPNVRFQEGQAFSSRDVAFNFERAASMDSGVRAFVGSIARIEVIDPLTVDVHLRQAQPNLLRSLAGWYQLSAQWCNAQGCQFGKADAHVRSHANGTGPYRLDMRTPGKITRFQRNTDFHEPLPRAFSQVEFTIMADDASRVAALNAGTVDIINPMPLSALAAKKPATGVQIIKRQDARVLFLGMDVNRPELLYSSVKGRNPLKDARVRQALYHAIDIERLVSDVMKTAARATGVLIPKGTFGHEDASDIRLPFEPGKARQLLAEAGYPDGFSLRLNCPDDRYLNDEALCRAIATQLADIGVKLELKIEHKSPFFAQVLSGDTSFYLLGAGTNTGDGFNILAPVMGSPSDGERGELNIGRYHNARVDALLHSVESETDPARRMASYREIFAIGRHEVGHIPLLQPYAVWGVREGLQLRFMPENGIPWRFIQRQDA